MNEHSNPGQPPILLIGSRSPMGDPAPQPPRGKWPIRQSGQSVINTGFGEGPVCVQMPPNAPGPLTQIWINKYGYNGVSANMYFEHFYVAYRAGLRRNRHVRSVGAYTGGLRLMHGMTRCRFREVDVRDARSSFLLVNLLFFMLSRL